MTTDEKPSRVVRLCVAGANVCARVTGYGPAAISKVARSTGGDYHLGADGRLPEILVLGDSHAAHLRHGLDTLLQQHDQAGHIIYRNSTDLFNLQQRPTREAVQWLDANPSVKVVILSCRWSMYEKRQGDGMYTRIEEFLDRVSAPGRRVLVTADVPAYDGAPCDIAARLKMLAPRAMRPWWCTLAQSLGEYEGTQGEINRQLAAACLGTATTFVPLHEALRFRHGFMAFDRDGERIVPLYFDNHHLTRHGSLLAARFLLSFTEREDAETLRLPAIRPPSS